MNTMCVIKCHISSLNVVIIPSKNEDVLHKTVPDNANCKLVNSAESERTDMNTECPVLFTVSSDTILSCA